MMPRSAIAAYFLWTRRASHANNKADCFGGGGVVLSGWQHLTDEDRKKFADGIVGGRTAGGPWHLELHPTNRCNVRCFFCINEFHRPHGDHATLPWENLYGLLNQLADRDLKMIRLSGGGEPLIYPQIRELLDLMARRNIRIVDLNTNGTRLKDLAREILAVPTDLITVSLNEPTPERYEKTMQTPKERFWRVVKGIERLQAAAPATNRPQIRIQFFMHRDNWRELPRMYALGRELGADFIFIRTLLERPAEERIAAEHIPELKRLLTEVIEKDAGEGRLVIDMSQESELHHFAFAEMARLGAGEATSVAEFNTADPRHEYCFMPWYTAVIGVEGAVYPCCLMMGRPLGNILGQPWDEIWDGPEFRRLRQEIRELMLLRGEATHCGRLFKCLSPICLPKYGCQWTYRLCTPEFYESVSHRIERDSSPLDRMKTRIKHNAVHAARRVKKFLAR